MDSAWYSLKTTKLLLSILISNRRTSLHVQLSLDFSSAGSEGAYIVGSEQSCPDFFRQILSNFIRRTQSVLQPIDTNLSLTELTQRSTPQPTKTRSSCIDLQYLRARHQNLPFFEKSTLSIICNHAVGRHTIEFPCQRSGQASSSFSGQDHTRSLHQQVSLHVFAFWFVLIHVAL